MRKNIFYHNFIFFLTLIVASCSTITKKNIPDETSKGVSFVQKQSLSQVLEKAKAQNKLVFIDFYADWCAPCKVMDKEVYADKTTAQFLNDNFISYKVNETDDNAGILLLSYEIQAYPTLLFVNNKGKTLERAEGGMGQSDFLTLAKSALQKK